MIYLDNAATTQVDPRVLDAMLPYLQDQYGNPGSLYKLGRKAKEAVDKARQQVADLIGAKPAQIIFTSGGTEANNMVFSSTADFLKSMGKKHIIVSSVEHDSVLKASEAMCIKDGFYKSYLGVNSSGVVDPSELHSLITDDTGLVSVMFANNEVEAVNDVAEISRICRKNRILFHTDCVQAAGYHHIDVEKIGCDFLSISSHKIHGIKGAGALFVKDKKILSPLINGGAFQEFGLRGGTENVAGIVGFGAACEIAGKELKDNAQHVSRLSAIFIKSIHEEFYRRCMEDLLKRINGRGAKKTGKVVNITIDGIDGETLLLMLDQRGVCVSAGSACRSHKSEPSNVLTSMGLSDSDARSSIRVSFSKTNTVDEIEEAAKIIADCVGVLYNRSK